MTPEQMKAMAEKMDAAKAKLQGMMDKPDSATPEAIAEMSGMVGEIAAMCKPSKAADPAPADGAKPAEGAPAADPAAQPDAAASKTDEEISPEDQAKIDALKQEKLKRFSNPFSPIKANSGF